MSKAKVIHMVDVKSSQVSEAGYDATTGTLAVKFKSGGTYHYFGVTQGAYESLLKAKSFWKQLQASIVGKHKHVKL